MLDKIDRYRRLYDGFAWRMPARYNIGVDVADRWAARDPDRPAILLPEVDGRTDILTYGGLAERSNRFANALRAQGVAPGDRVAIMLGQGFEVAIAHVAIYKLGAIAVPLAALFGLDALQYRLGDCGAAALITDRAGLAKLAAIRAALGDLRVVISVDGAEGEALDFHALLARGAADFEAIGSTPDDPALMIYTSGTTGAAKGALHGHRVLLGHMPGFEMPHEGIPQAGDRMWTPADWAWAGGLLNALLPSLKLGVPVVARKFEKFDPDEAFALIAAQRIRNLFVPPTALRMLRAVEAPKARHGFDLRTVCSAGEALGAETYEWGQAALGVTVNEAYGQTECNLVLASSAGLGITRAGTIGKAVPGHRVAIIDGEGRELPAGTPGQIAVARPDPVMFLRYWNRPEATEAKFIGDWMTTGDEGVEDEDGYVRFIGRDDDVITSAGYRIGPAEIEDCLIKHPAVQMAAAVGKPDGLRTEIVKAFLVLKPGTVADGGLSADIQRFVRERLSAHEYPREIAFVDALPMTTSGKIIRRQLRDAG